MKVSAIIATSMSLFAGVLLHAVSAATPRTEAKIRWHADLKVAHQEAVRLNRPLLIVFGADWCTYCRKMEETTLSSPGLIDSVKDNYIPVRLDLDRDRRIADVLEVERLPCTVFLSPQADLLGRVVGFVGPEQYRSVVGKAHAVHVQLQQHTAATVTGEVQPISEPDREQLRKRNSEAVEIIEKETVTRKEPAHDNRTADVDTSVPLKESPNPDSVGGSGQSHLTRPRSYQLRSRIRTFSWKSPFGDWNRMPRPIKLISVTRGGAAR